MKVDEIMAEEVVTIHKDRKLSDAIDTMEKQRVSRLLVVNGSELIGIITERDILDTLGSGKHGNVLPSRLHVSSAISKNLITINRKADLKEAAELMLKMNIRSLPVVNSQLEGIVTTTDLLKPLTDSSVYVKEIMSTPVITVLTTDRVVHARRLMLDNNVGRLIVVEDFNIAGIITQRQLGRAMAAFKKNADSHQANRIRNLLVEDVMSQNVITISEDTTAGEAAKIMLDNVFSGLPVVREKTLVGIVTKKDIIKLYQ